MKLAVVGNKLERLESRQSGERVGRYVLAKTERQSKGRTIGQFVWRPIPDDCGEESVLVAEKAGFSGCKVRRLGNDTIEAEWVKGLVTVEKTEFGNKIGSLGDDPEVVIETTDIAATTGVEKGANLDGRGSSVGTGDAKIPRNIRQTHVDVERHRRRAAWIGLRVVTADTDWKPKRLGTGWSARWSSRCCSRRGGLGIRGWGRRVRERR